MESKAKYYREEALQCRELARTLSALPKEHMLDVARQYDKLAEQAEAREHPVMLQDFPPTR
jgi:hypothetical protein